STRVEAEGGTYFGQSGTLAKNVFSTITISNIVVGDGVLDLAFRAPAGYTGYWLVCGLDLAASVADLPPTAPQRLEGLTFDQHGLEQTSTARLASVSRAGQLLTSELVEQARREAVADWITTGLTPGQILALQNATVQITDLNSEGAFGFAGSRMIQLDDDALGFGWHVGSGPVPTGAVDLGTVMRHELGHILGYGDLDPTTAGDSIMSGTILPGERRTVSQAEDGQPVTLVETSPDGAPTCNGPESLFPPTYRAEPTSLVAPTAEAPDSADSCDSLDGPVPIPRAALSIAIPTAAAPMAEKSEDLLALDDLFSDALAQLF
ncbi:MAG: hypothetical protein ACK56U_18705, partial [Planctomyces sp.]